MKNLIIFFSFALSVAGTVMAQDGNGPDMKKYVLDWQDDFNGSTLDLARWDYRQDGVTRNNGGISYDSLTRSMVLVKDGVLWLGTGHMRDRLFTASMISTEKHPDRWMHYGYTEIRSEFPPGFGSGSAFWLQSPTVNIENNDPIHNGAEVDIFEYGNSSGIDSIFHSVVWNGYGAAKQVRTARIKVAGISRGWHTYGLEWTPNEYIVYVDGRVTARSKIAVSQRSECIILSCGTGGYGGDPMVPNALFPVYFKVDYIKVYRPRS